MRRIVVGITSLEQHEQALELTPEIYRPASCPHCGIKILWSHGHYSRKADLCNRGEANHNPVAILRYRCSVCRRTCSRLPECIAPRRWYNWCLQQSALYALLTNGKAQSPPPCPTPAPRTLGRWWHWLEERSAQFRFALTSRFPELGRAGDDATLWLGVLDSLGLARAMAWLDQEISVP
jgi:hypothetical protein